MNEQELQIARLLFNEMAFEGVMSHFDEASPVLDIELFHRLERSGKIAGSDGRIHRSLTRPCG